MPAYYLDLDQPLTSHSPIPCTYVPSVNPGKTLLVRESDGASMCVEPDGSQVRWIAAGASNFDSAWTQFDALSGFAVFRSAAGAVPPPPTPAEILGVPRMYKMVD